MLRKFLIGAGFLVLTLMLNPDYSAGQPGGGKGKGNWGGNQPGGFGQPPGGGFGQPGGGRGGFGQPGGGQGGGGGGRGGPQMDPEQAWDMMVKMSGGTDTIKFDNIPAPTKQFLKNISDKSGSPPLPETGEWNKAQYMDYFAKSQAARANAPGGQNMGGPGAGGSGMGGPGGGNFDVDAMAEQRFRQSDLNGDGRLSYDEASERLKPRFQEVDTNRDGYIDLAEYKAYMAAAMGRAPGSPGMGPQGPQRPNGYGGDPNGPPGGWSGGPGGWDGPGGREDRKEKEPPVFAIRYGKLPDGLPDWWAERDTDKDGQIGLYEWRAAGEDMKEFTAMDLNGDGLLAPDEYLRFERLKAETKADEKKAAALANGDSPGPGSRGAGSGPGAKGGAPARGGPPPGGFPGGPGGGKSGPPGGDTKGTGDPKKDDKPGGTNPWANGGKKNKGT